MSIRLKMEITFFQLISDKKSSIDIHFKPTLKASMT